jgi:hypothetical protein
MTEKNTSVVVAARHPAGLVCIELLKTESGSALTDEFFTEHDDLKRFGLDFSKEGTAWSGCGRRTLRSAMRHCLMHHGISWDREHGAGRIVRQDASMARNTSRRAFASQRKQLRRNGTRLACTHNESMTDEERREHNVLEAITGTQLAVLEPSTRKKLLARNVEKALDARRLLEAMQEAQGRD